MDDRMALLATATKALVDSYTESESQRLTAARMAISLVIQALTAAAQKEDYDIDLIDKLHHLQTELHATEAEIDAALAEPAAQRKAGIAVFSHSPADWTPEMVEAFNKYRSAQEPEAAMDEPVALAAEDEGSPRTEPWPQSVIDSIREQADRAQGLVDRMFQPPTQVECVPASHS